MRLRLLFFCVLCLLMRAGPVHAETTGTASIVPIAPLACPAAGCAAGQRLSYRLQYDLGSFDKTISPKNNVKVCVYISSSWSVSPIVSPSTDGSISELSGSGAPRYTLAEINCDLNLTGYDLVVDASASMKDNIPQDTLDLSFRIKADAIGRGNILLQVFEYNNAGIWVMTSTSSTPQQQIAAHATTAYVASNPTDCTNSPCYLNSAGDYSGGVGTGLRDAVDAQQLDETIVVLGSALVKKSTVSVSKALNIVGIDGGGTISVEAGTACGANDGALLVFTNGGSLNGLSVDDNGCAGTIGRRLVEINSAKDVQIESNNLVSGTDAIYVIGNTGNVAVRYNLISGSTLHALFWDKTSSTAALTMVANNVFGGVECSDGINPPPGNRKADHNYWGSPAAPDPTNVHCSLTAGKQLGAPIAPLVSGVGLDAKKLTVEEGQNRTAFGGLISFNRVGGKPFDIYIVNHGSNFQASLPFAGNFSMPNLCSNVWDVFLAEGAIASPELDLYFRYDLTSACIAAVNISTFCGQSSSPQNIPLWWYDPRGVTAKGVTAGWDTTGQNPAGPEGTNTTGQTTSCSAVNREIKVAIDTNANRHPNLSGDLNFTPFLVGIPVTTSFMGLASSQTVTLNWTTVSEPDVSGYIVLRSNSPAGPFNPITDVIARKGSAITGSNYFYADTGLTITNTYYYRLKAIRTDNSYTFSDVLPINLAATPTPTITPTITVTPSPTITRTPYPTSVPYRSPVPAATRVPTLVPTRYASPTSARTTPNFARTLTPGTQQALSTQEGAYPGPNQSPSPGANESGTPAVSKPQPGGTLTATGGPKLTPTPSRSPAPTLSYAEQVRNSSRYVSLVMGLLLGVLGFVGAAWFIFFRKRPVL